jgi:transposase
MHSILLPDPALFELISYSLAVKVLNLEIKTKSQGARCPDCHQLSNRIHSSYVRTVRDLPMASFAVVLHVCVQRFFCDNKFCPRCTFTERMPGNIEAYARRTNRMVNSQREVGFVAGGEAGSKLTRNLALPTSPDTLIRLVRHTVIQAGPTPKYLGIDDWALRKGHSYGTILVDLETHRPIELLPDRSAETVRKWLLEHPGVEIVSRDRASAYIEAITAGAPQAIQVADRWHLLHNLVEAIERVLNRRYALLQEAFRKSYEANITSESVVGESQKPEQIRSEPPKKRLTATELQRQSIREKHRAQFDEIRRLRNEEGLGIRAICRRLRVGREKVRKNLANEEPPEYKRRKQRTILTPYWGYLEQRWAAGQRNGMVLWKEIKAMGFTGTYQSMARELVPLRKKMPKEKRRFSMQKQLNRKATATEQVRPFSTRQTAWLFVKKRDQLEGEKARYLDQLLATSAEFQRLQLLVQQFWAMVCERKRDQLQTWLSQAKTAGIVEMKNFAQGLEKDFQAVEAALTYSWSNGPTEGHNNRLKMIKRQMYGRAKFDLLRNRILYSGS